MLLCNLLATVVFGISEDYSIEAVATKLKTMQDRVLAMEARYELRHEPTEKFLREYARDTKTGLDDVRRQFSDRLLCDWAERSSGERFLDVTAFDDDGQRKYHRLIAYDLKENWTLNYLTDIEFPVTEVTLGIDNSLEFQGTTRFKDLSGWTLTLSYPQPLFRCLQESTEAEILGRQRMMDTECIKIRSTIPGKEVTSAVVAWLDPVHDFALRELDQQILHQGSWFTTKVHRVTSLCLLRDEGGGSATLWCPEEGVTEVFNGRGEVTTIERFKLIEGKLNPVLLTSKFTPAIEVGSNMRDVRTGRLWVHGDRASPEIEQLVAERVKQAKVQLRDAASTGSVSPSRSWATFFAWASAAGVITGLGVAVLLWCQARR